MRRILSRSVEVALRRVTVPDTVPDGIRDFDGVRNSIENELTQALSDGLDLWNMPDQDLLRLYGAMGRNTLRPFTYQ